MTKKPSKPRRAKIDSIEEHVRIVQRATMVIVPPPDMWMNEKSRTYFDEIIAEKVKADWTAHHISIAAMLSRLMAELDYNQEKMMKEGALVKNKGGEAVLNPRRKIICEYFAQINTTRRSLGLHALAGGIDMEKVVARQAMAREIETASLTSADSLISYPTVQ